MSKTLKWILFSLVGLVVILVIVKAVTGKGDEGSKVTAEVVKKRTIIETVTASGKVYPETEIKVGSPISGEVITLNVHEGDTVTKGQMLAFIRGDRTGSSPQRISLPTIPPGFESLVQGMSQPRTTSSASSATITAPISGTVLGLNIKQGERIGTMQMPGSELMRVADMNNIEVRVDVNENNIIKVSVGDSADVEVEAYNKRKFKGIVTSIGNGGTKKDAQSFMSNDVTAYEVHIKLDRASYADLFDSSRRKSLPFRTGMNARADIKTKRREAVLSVPVGAVVSKPQGSEESLEDTKKDKAKEDAITTDEPTTTDELEEIVFVMKADKTVEKRVVTTGIQDINYFEILSGLKEGEQVVTGPYGVVSKTLRSGKKVTVVAKEKLFETK
ncbi:MAG: HlyD family efflux transporter periplasmic adaptor subunit [Flavisolibacter sp.]|jgi:HlyD family secretion protein|nr:HlyD family efflux transporter periplasmic adaptor subunit [Flavisolibacter sp.]